MMRMMPASDPREWNQLTITGSAEKPPPPLIVGDVITFEGVYRRRTFWQWMTRAPRQILTYRVTDVLE
jgi:hypothetical protein